jgi:hypothetical protein
VVHDRGDTSGHGSAWHCWCAEFLSVQDGLHDPHLWQCWLWDPTDSMVHQVKQCPDSNHVMTLQTHHTNRLLGRIWRIRQLLQASQPLQPQIPPILPLQVHHHHGLSWQRIPTLRMLRRSCCTGITVSDTSHSGTSNS